MPSRTSRDYRAVEPIQHPEVPPEVLNKPSEEEQIVEMREWFTAWKNQDHSVRDYRNYFKPILCYLEGAWTIPIPGEMDEPFESDRHSLNAVDWDEMNRKIRFMSNTGAKDNNENFAFLPTSLFDMENDTEPIFAQWNYRILCHPLSKYVHLNRMRMVDDLSARVSYGQNKNRFRTKRGARFQLNTVDSAYFRDDKHENGLKFIDDLMNEIPGMDNYGAVLTENSFNMESKRLNDSTKTLNVGYYHQSYQVSEKGANGLQQRARGFADNGVYMAMNTQSRVVTNVVDHKCSKVNGVKVCQDKFAQKWSYAVPLEIIYLTPLSRWNPYNIEINEDGIQCSACKGGNTKDTAYEFASRTHHYLTPSSFFSGDPEGDAADTSGGEVGMLDSHGNLRKVRASGIYVFLPEIRDVGVLRQRYPIAPIHQEGEALWKEFQALKDLMFLMGNRYEDLRKDYGIDGLPGQGEGPTAPDINLYMSYAPINEDMGVTAHTHQITLDAGEVLTLTEGGEVEARTEEANGHYHTLKLHHNATRYQPFYYVRCEGQKLCWDGHGKFLYVDEQENN